ncbi:MAG: hypothetical protein ACRDXX_16720 [Stackebrandtia sp.]
MTHRERRGGAFAANPAYVPGYGLVSWSTPELVRTVRYYADLHQPAAPALTFRRRLRVIPQPVLRRRVCRCCGKPWRQCREGRWAAAWLRALREVAGGDRA